MSNVIKVKFVNICSIFIYGIYLAFSEKIFKKTLIFIHLIYKKGALTVSYKKHFGFLKLGLFFTFSLFWLELITMIFCTGIQNINLLILFSSSVGFTTALIISLIPFETAGRVSGYVLLSFITIIFITEILLWRTFGFFYPPETILGMAEDVVGSYSGTVFATLRSGIIPIILSLLPILLFSLFNRCFSFKPHAFLGRTATLVIAILLHFGARNTIDTISKAQHSPTDAEYYSSEFEFTESTSRFGLCTSIRLNTLYSFIGIPRSSIPLEQPPVNDIKDDIEYNLSDFNLNKLSKAGENSNIRSLATAFSAEAPTEKNSYSEIYKGKNLILICAEALSPYVIDPELTPTLYKLTNEGISFKNYYQPSFGESTLGGEYALLCSQIPGRSVGEKGLTMQLACSENLKYSLPGLFSEADYNCLGFHNNSYSYYSRDKTHPKLGLNWYGVGGSKTDELHDNIDIGEMLSNGWPRSDDELVVSTFDIYKDSEKPFFTYYLSVSGHNNYSFSENTQARKNRHKAEQLNFCEQVQAYIACQLELEKALTSLISLLGSAGIADKTVIALSNDHYPYGLSASWQGNGGKDLLSELAGKKLDRYEREKGVFFIWSADMKEGIVIEKPTCGADVMPTLLNLFGIEYDSRLLAGRDALSSCMGSVMFSDYSFMTDKGGYFAETDRYYTNGDTTLSDLKELEKQLQARIKNSRSFRKLCFIKHLRSI